MNVAAQVNIRQDESLAGSASVSRNSSILSAFGLRGGSQNIEDETIKMGSQGYVKKIVRKYALNFEYTQTEFLGLSKTKLYDQSPVIMSVDEAVSDTIFPLIFILDIKKQQTDVKMKLGRKVIAKYEVNSFPSILETPFGAFTISKSEYFDEKRLPLKIQVFCSNYDFMTQIYRSAIKVSFEKKSSDLIQLSMNTENVKLAKTILNELIKNYNDEWLADKNIVTDKTQIFIDERLKTVYEDLMQADQAIQNFKNLHNLTDIEADVKYNYTLSGGLQQVLLEAETQLKLIDYYVSLVSNDANKYSSIPLLINTNPAMAEAIVKYNEVLTQRNDAYKTPSQSSIVKNLNEKVEAQRETFLTSIGIAKKGFQITVDDIKKKESEVKNKIGKIPGIEKIYLQLKREQELHQAVYIFLLEMQEETGVKGVTLLPKLKVIDEPYVINQPVEPRLLKVAITTLFFGGLLFPLSAIYGFPLIKNYMRRKK